MTYCYGMEQYSTNDTRGVSYNGLYEEGLPGRGTFFRLRVYKSDGDFTNGDIWRGRKICHLTIAKGIQLKYFEVTHFMTVSFNFMKHYKGFLFGDLFITRAGLISIWKRDHFSIKGKRKGYLFYKNGCQGGAFPCIALYSNPLLPRGIRKYFLNSE